MTEEQKIEELELVRPDKFGINEGQRFFCCPQCKSKAVALNPMFSKNNIAVSLQSENNLKNKENIVLVCVNCQYTDLLISFIGPERSFYNETNYSDLVKPYTLPKGNKPKYYPLIYPKTWSSRLRPSSKKRVGSGLFASIK